MRDREGAGAVAAAAVGARRRTRGGGGVWRDCAMWDGGGRRVHPCTEGTESRASQHHHRACEEQRAAAGRCMLREARANPHPPLAAIYTETRRTSAAAMTRRPLRRQIAAEI